MKKIAISLGLILLLFGAGKINYSYTGGFRVHKVRSNLSYDPKWDSITYAEISEIKERLQQPFTYLGRGAQCYAFLSSDGKTVLKLFKFHHLNPSSFWRTPHFGPFEKWRFAIFNNAQVKFNQMFSSFLIANEKLPSSTALIYLHLNKSDHLKQKITLITPFGVKHTLDADKLEFALQQYARSFYDELNELLKAGQTKQALDIVSSLQELWEEKMQLGIFDYDPALSTNFGCIDGKVVQFDCGSLLTKPSQEQIDRCQRNHIKQMHHLSEWLAERNVNVNE